MYTVGCFLLVFLGTVYFWWICIHSTACLTIILTSNPWLMAPEGGRNNNYYYSKTTIVFVGKIQLVAQKEMYREGSFRNIKCVLCSSIRAQRIELHKQTLRIRNIILNSMLPRTSSKCNSHNNGVMWQNLEAQQIILAQAFIACCSLWS